MGFEKNSFGAIPSVGGIQLFDGIQSTQNATEEIAGLMSAEDKAKLDSLHNYVHPDSGVKAGKYMQVEVNEQGHVTGGRTLQEGTLADYGIIDAYIDLTDNSIIIGPNRVKPLTPSDKVRWEQMVDTPDTLAGYGIVDAKITDDGIIQLGLMTIKPLTAESELNTDNLVGVIKALNLPDKLADYGITDVALKDGTINIGGDLITPLTADSKLAADKIDGVIDISHIPQGAMERCVVVDDDTARFALTTNEVQKGDTVKVVNPSPTMYMVVDEDNLDNAAGYVVYSAGNANSVPWSGITGKPATYYTLPPADINTLGGIMVGANLSIAPDGTLSTHAPYVLPEATANTLGGVKIGANVEVQSDGTISVPNATSSVAGVVKAGNNINIGADGTISGIAYNLPVATATELGGIKIGQNVETLGDGTLSVPIASELKAGVVKLGGNITVDGDGVLNAPTYQLPTATALRLGGIKVGKYLSVDSEGLLNATGVPTIATKKDIGGVIVGDNINVDSDGKISVVIPDKLSEFTNDSGFITSTNLSNHNDDVNAHRELFTKIDNSVTNTFKSVSSLAPNIKRNTTYQINDCASSPTLPNWAYLKCTRAGTTSDTSVSLTGKNKDDVVSDGSTMWLVKELGANDSSNTNNAAAAPNYYERSECYKAKDTSAAGRRTIVTPASLWLNVNNAGYGLAVSKELDLSNDSTWSANAQKWQANHAYAVDDVVYPLSGKTSYYYRCVTAGTSSSLEPTFPTTLGQKYNDGNCQWICELDYTLAANRAGRDFYIFIGVNPDKSLKTCISANSTVPYGYTADTSRKVGGFHCLCADVGTISGHKLSGYVQGDILPASVWDLNHRPKSEPEGMVYVSGLDIWVDIYLCSWTGSTANKNLKAISKYGAVTGDGTSAEKFHPLKWEQTMGEQNKRLPWVREFRIFSVGSNQSTNIKGSADANTAGGHIDTAGRRMISDYGIEDCCGFLWQWCNDVGSASTSASWGNGFDANDRSDVKGQIYGAEYRPIVGSYWGNGAICGSRSAAWDNGSLRLDAACGARSASEPVGRNA